MRSGSKLFPSICRAPDTASRKAMHINLDVHHGLAGLFCSRFSGDNSRELQSARLHAARPLCIAGQ